MTKPKSVTQDDYTDPDFRRKHSTAHAWDPGDELSMTDPRFAPDTDIQRILRGHGALDTTRQPIFGEINFDNNLQTAMEAVKVANRLYATMPKELHQEFPTPQAILTGLTTGAFQKKIEAVLTERHQKSKSGEPTFAENVAWLRKNLTALASSTPAKPTSAPAAVAG